MKLKRYTSILTAAMLLAGSIQSIPVTAHTAAASAVTEKAPDADTKAEPKDSEEAVPAPETTDPSADGMTAAETVQTTAVSDDSGPAETVMTEKPDPVQIAADSLGEKITWALDSDGHLRIRGAGAMSDGTGCPFGYDAGKVTDAVIENTDPEDPITVLKPDLFHGCQNLTSVTLPDSIRVIGSEAFRDCTALKEIALPDHLAEIGTKAFRNTGLTEAILPGCTLGDGAFYDNNELQKVSIGEGTLTIPSECFRYCSALETVTLPDSLKEIQCGEYDSMGAFAECPSLKSVSIGKGIESISQYAFRTTGSDLAVTFREGVTAIPESAFSGRGELKTVILPDTLESIGSSAFRNCPNLTGTVFPASLREIGAAAFRNTGLTEAVLPGCTLGACAFYDSEKLQKVSIGEGTLTIPSECFRYCSALETVTLPDSLKEIQSGEYDSTGAFAECPSLRSVSIGKGIETISQYAFRTAGSDLAVTFREGVTAIPESAFSGRGELKTVILPDTLESIGSSAFRNCPNLTGTVFPASLREIGAEAFRHTGLTEAILPGCTLGACAFYDSEKLKEVSIGEGTLTIPSECFRYCSALETVTLPDSLKEIQCGEYDSTGAFAECPSLRSVSIGKGIESISQYAFRTTGSDLAVTFREGVTAIPESAFDGRSELKTVILPDTLESIGSSAFRNCPNLTGTVFPASLREIGAEAFRHTGLTEAILPGCTLGASAFYDSEKLKEVSIGEGTPIIPSECFRYCSALETVTLPDSLKEIQCGQFDSMGAFAECPALKSVSIGKGIESISQHAFRTTGTELDVTFRDGASGIPDNAFRNRIELMRIVVPASAETLGSGAVSRCGNLRAIVFASPGCSIQDNAGEIPESAVIYGYKDSTAEAYANKYGRIFIPLRTNDPSVPFSCDLNADGKTDSEDAILLLRVVTEIPPADGELDASALGMADLDCSGTLTLKDVSLLLTAITVPPAAP